MAMSHYPEAKAPIEAVGDGNTIRENTTDAGLRCPPRATSLGDQCAELTTRESWHLETSKHGRAKRRATREDATDAVAGRLTRPDIFSD
jgi:hypothetical protein